MKGKSQVSDESVNTQPNDALKAETDSEGTFAERIKRSEGIAVIDKQGTLVYANPAFARLHGYDLPDLIGMKLNEFVIDNSPDYLKEILDIRGEESLQIKQAVHKTKDGSPLPAVVSAIPIRPGKEFADHTVIIVRKKLSEEPSPSMEKMTTAKGKEIDLRDTEWFRDAYLRALDEAIGAVLFTSSSGVIQFANKSAAALFGYKPYELNGQSLVSLLPESLHTEMRDFLESPKQVRWVGEFTRARRNGKQRHIKLSLMKVDNPDAHDSFVLASAKDVTELRMMEIHLRQAQKLEAIGLLASGLAHNINSPLSAIVMTAEIAQTKYPEVSEFDDILQATARINEIVNNLMTKSRQEQTDTEMDIDINQLVKTELKFLEANLFFKHNVERNTQLADNLPTVQGLYSDFSQCFQNLVSNAIDAMSQSENCELIVYSRYDEASNRIILSIRDSGSGIARNDLQKIFEPFFTTKAHLHETDSGRPSGTGLGLSAVRQLLARYGADITVESELGKGSEFTVSIPVKTPSSISADS